ncbi:hypothetical protein GYMLUDRAFT_182097, partial [Collybiopsis luxurians FD-317 M1]
AFTHSNNIDNARNRYMLCKSSTQEEIGLFSPVFITFNEKDPPFYMCISWHLQGKVLDRAIQKVEELLAIDMDSWVEDKNERARRKWPEGKIPAGLESVENFYIRV